MEGGEVTGARPVLRGAGCGSRRRAPGAWVPALEGGDPACAGHAGRMGSPGGRCRGRWGAGASWTLLSRNGIPCPRSLPGHVPAAGDRRMGSVAGERRRRPGAPPPRPHPARPRREALGYFWPVPSAFGGPAQAAPSWTHPGGRPGTPSSAQATLCSAPACRFFEDLGSDLGLLSSDQGGLDVRSPPGWAWGSDGSVRARAAPSPTLVGAAPGWARRLVLACPVTLGRVTAVGSHCASVPLTS